MSEEFNDLMRKYKDYIDVSDAIYKLKTLKEEEINDIYNNIKIKLIENGIISASESFKMIETAIKYNNRYFKSYFSLLQKLSIEYHLNKEEQLHKYEKYYENLNNGPNSEVLHAIMNDDKIKLIILTQFPEFDIDQEVISPLFPLISMKLLDLCCYYGSLACFRYLKSETNITRDAVTCYYLGGNIDIISECLGESYENSYWIEEVIASHNIDFFNFCMNEIDLKSELRFCGNFKNLHALFVYYDLTKDVNSCFAVSSTFNIPSLCEYFISHGAFINTRFLNGYGHTALQLAALKDCDQSAEFLISKGIDTNALWAGLTALHLAARSNSVNTLKVLILHCDDINVKGYNNRTPLHIAASHCRKEAFELLVSYGADINAKDGSGVIPHL